MLLFGLGLAAASLLQATAEAPITAVTVYSDRARVVRTATLTLSGTQRVELPRLPVLVDPDSARSPRRWSCPSTCPSPSWTT